MDKPTTKTAETPRIWPHHIRIVRNESNPMDVQEMVTLDFARTLERELSARDELLREAMNGERVNADLYERIRHLLDERKG